METKQILLEGPFVNEELEILSSPKIAKYKGIGTGKNILPIYVDCARISNFFKGWSSDNESNLLMITGEPGSGKTTSVMAGAVSNDYWYARFDKSFQDYHMKSKFLAFQTQIAKVSKTVNGPKYFEMMKYIALNSILLMVLEVNACASDSPTKSQKFLYGKPTTMLTSVEKRYNELENEKQQLIDNFLSIGWSTIAKKARAANEEIIEIMNHLIPFDFSHSKKRDALIIHLDETQHWEYPPFEKIPRNDPQLPVDGIEKYDIICLVEAIFGLKNLTSLRFAVTGTQLGMYSIIRETPQDKCDKIYLKCPNLKEFLQAETNLEENDISQCSDLWGCPRAVQYFIQECSLLDKSNFKANELVEKAYISFRNEHIGTYGRLKGAASIFDELMFSYVFCEALGGKKEKDTFKFKLKNIPHHWLDFAQTGVIRMDLECDNVTLYKPYPFLERFMHEHMQIFKYQDVRTLHNQINSEDTRKGICFQNAVALELSCLNSKLWGVILEKINEKAASEEKPFYLSPHALPQRIISSFKNEADVTESLVLYVSSEQSNMTKAGDIQMINFVDNYQYGTTKMFICCQNKMDTDETITFFEKCMNRTVQEENNEIYILLSLQNLSEKMKFSEQWKKIEEDYLGKGVERKTFLSIFGVDEIFTSIGIKELSIPQVHVPPKAFEERFKLLVDLTNVQSEEPKPKKRKMN